MDHLLNVIRREAMRALLGRATKRNAIVDSYDPNRYACRVRFQPDNTLSGWIPITSQWIGNGWGLFCPPSPGDQVSVDFQLGSVEKGIVEGRYFGAVNAPLAVPSGEFWLVHKSGSLLKFTNDGNVTVSAAQDLVLSAARDVTITAGRNATMTAAATGRVAGATVQVHATTEYRWDTNGHGQVWFASYVDTWQTGETSGTAHPITPPEIPE